MKVTFEKDEIVIRVPASAADKASAPKSKSGKTRLLATTNGFTSVAGTDMKLSLNVTVP